MIRRLTTAHENRSEWEGTTSVVPTERHAFKEALAAEGYLSPLNNVRKTPQGLKPLILSAFVGTTEVVPSRTYQSPKRIFTSYTEMHREVCVWLRGLRVSVVSAVLVLSGCSTKQEAQSNASSLRPVAAHGTDAGVKFTAPSGWIQETPSSSMRVAQYRLPRDERDSEDAEMAVFYFQGQGGSVQANIDRWIGQFIKADGSPASDVARVNRKDSGGVPLTIVDVSGTYTGSGGPMATTARPKPDFRMLAAVAETSSGPYFFKLTGPVKTVAKWESSFHAFLNSIQ